MKALSLWQPWATLMAERYKRIETRSWPTKYRGELAIHAAKKIAPEGVALWRVEQESGAIPGFLGRFDELPKGRLLCVVELIDCVPTDWLLHSHEDAASRWRNANRVAPSPRPPVELGNAGSDRPVEADGVRAWVLDHLSPCLEAVGLTPTVPEGVRYVYQSPSERGREQEALLEYATAWLRAYEKSYKEIDHDYTMAKCALASAVRAALSAGEKAGK